MHTKKCQKGKKISDDLQKGADIKSSTQYEIHKTTFTVGQN